MLLDKLRVVLVLPENLDETARPDELVQRGGAHCKGKEIILDLGDSNIQDGRVLRRLDYGLEFLEDFDRASARIALYGAEDHVPILRADQNLINI